MKKSLRAVFNFTKKNADAAVVFLRASTPVLGVIYFGSRIFGTDLTMFCVCLWMAVDLYSSKFASFLRHKKG